jgi:putative ABC transport system permease protein
MKTPLAFYNLWHQRAKTLVSISGVAFALLLVFMQLGFMGAVSDTATNVLKSVRFDAMIRSRDYLHLYEPNQFERKWLSVAASTPGVQDVQPLWITIHNWRKLPTQKQLDTGSFDTQYLPIAMMAFNPQQTVFELPDVLEQQTAVESGQSILVDRATQRDYGPLNGREFSPPDIGRSVEIGGKEFVIDGLFRLGTGLAANGAAITSVRGFSRIVPWNTSQQVSLGLVTFSDTVEREQVLSALDERMRTNAGRARAVDVLSREEALNRETNHWLWHTPIGLIFQLGVVLSMLVGAAIVYMVLSTDVTNRLSEYATLLAMGYSRIFLASIVMTQAVLLSILGFSVAWGVAEVLYRVTSYVSGIPVAMNSQRVVLVSLLGLVMCCFSGLLALRKLWKAEPASLF